MSTIYTVHLVLAPGVAPNYWLPEELEVVRTVNAYIQAFLLARNFGYMEASIRHFFSYLTSDTKTIPRHPE